MALRAEEEQRRLLLAGLGADFPSPHARLHYFLRFSSDALAESPLLAVMTDPQEAAALMRELPPEMQAELQQSDDAFFSELVREWQRAGILTTLDAALFPARPRAIFALTLQRAVIGDAFPRVLELVIDALADRLAAAEPSTEPGSATDAWECRLAQVCPPIGARRRFVLYKRCHRPKHNLRSIPHSIPRSNAGAYAMQLARSVGVVLLAVFAGGAVIGLVEMAGHALVGGDRDAAQAGYSAAMYGVVLLAWALGTAVAVYIVTRFLRAHTALVLAVVAIFAALALVNLLTIPHPAWVFAAAVVAFGVGGFVGRASAVRQLEEVREG